MDRIKVIAVFLFVIALLYLPEYWSFGSMTTPKSKRVGLVFVDFDNTCTTHDTTGLLYKASQAYRNGDHQAKQQLDEKWLQLQQKYFQGYKDVMQKINVTSSKRSCLDLAGLENFLKSVSDFELHLTKDTENSQLLKNIDQHGLESIAKDVQLYKGCKEVLSKLGDSVRIISLNWSRYLVSLCLKGAVPLEQIKANNLLDKGAVSSGNLQRDLRNAFDKRDLILSEINVSKTLGITVFIGDSPHDLLAMIAADLGILVGKSRSVDLIAGRYGIQFKPLNEFNPKYDAELKERLEFNPCDNDEDGRGLQVLYQVTSWSEIDDFLG